MSEPSTQQRSTGRSPPTRRRILRGAATLVVASTAGCAEAIDGVPGTDDDPRPEAGSADADGSVASNRETTNEQGDQNDRVLAHEAAVHERVNEVRAGEDLDELAFVDSIADVARAHSVDMIERDYFAHESPDGETAGDRMSAFFPERCRGIGENLASVGRRPDDGPADVADRVVSGWMNSDGHRENLLRPGFDEEGIGVAFSEDGRVLVTQNLCSLDGSVG